tara:strand:+ start:23229 stop:23930 length:702 start_codon:yes stop_codon:yes gene_type:complete
MRYKNLVLLVVVTFLSNMTYAKTIQYWASATDLKSNRLVYREKHIEQYKNNRPTLFEVEYYSPTGYKFATKSVKFSNTDYDPDIYLNYPRMGYIEYTKRLRGNTYRLGNKSMNAKNISAKDIRVSGIPVVDNGFDLFIKDNINKLRQRQTLHIAYIAPAKLDYFRFRLQPIQITQKTIKVKIEPDAAVARWLTKPIIVVYDLQKNRMISYTGVTNIPKSHNENHNVRLSVEYD